MSCKQKVVDIHNFFQLHQNCQQIQPSTHLLFQLLYHAYNIYLTLNQNNAKTKQEDFVFQKLPKSFNATKCKLMDETIRGKYDDLFLVGNKPIARVKILIHYFFLALKCIVYHLLLKKHKDKIKVKITWYNSIEYICLVFVCQLTLTIWMKLQGKSWNFRQLLRIQ